MNKLFTSYCFLLCIVNINAQNISMSDSAYHNGNFTIKFLEELEEKDSIRPSKTTRIISSFQRGNSHFYIDNENHERFSLLHFNIGSTAYLSGYESLNNSSIFVPYSYTFNSFMEGITMKGFYGSHSFYDYLDAKINIFVSNTYFGNSEHPSFYINASFRAELVFKLHDRVQLTGTGQVSIREGLNPQEPSLMGGSNYYGAGLQFRLTNKIGIGVGFTNNYYRGEWTKRTFIAPVGY